MLDYDWRPFSELSTDSLYALLRLRSRVFVVEQSCVYADLDGRDSEAHHLCAREEGELVAYLRAFPPADGRAVIGRVVVDPDRRGSGLGQLLMREGQARVWSAWGPCAIVLSAQAHLASFYGALGYRVTGAPYDEDGILHVPMRLEAGESASGAYNHGV